MTLNIFSFWVFFLWFATDGYFVDHYCLWFDRGVVLVITTGYFVDYFLLRLDRGVVQVVYLYFS